MHVTGTMHHQATFILLLAIIMTGASCTKTGDFTADMKYDYYPLAGGHTNYYEVDSVKYNPLYDDGRDTFHWEIKEVLTDSFTTINGQAAYRFERYRRPRGSSNWKPPERGVVMRQNNRIEYQLNNLRLIPFIFPPETGVSWDGAAFIPENDTFDFYSDWENTFLAVDEGYDLEGSTYAETALVEDVDSENLLEYRFSESRYARDVGLIERTQYYLEFVGSVIPNEPWEEKATNGFIMHLRLTKSVPGG